MTNDGDLSPAVERVRRRLDELGYGGEIQTLSDSARTAEDAANALGTEVGAIAKSIVFRRTADDVPVLVVASGSNRVDITKLEELVGGVGKADAAFVRERTGFVIGGVSPLGMPDDVVIVFDRDLMTYGVVFAAAGHTHAVFGVAPGDLARYLDVQPDDVRVDTAEAPY